MRLDKLEPGARFQVQGCTHLVGALLRVGPGSCTVKWEQHEGGARQEIAPGTQVTRLPPREVPAAKAPRGRSDTTEPIGLPSDPSHSLF